MDFAAPDCMLCLRPEAGYAVFAGRQAGDRDCIKLRYSILRDSDRVFREHGEEAYRQYQREQESNTLEPGVAFPFIRRLLSLNAIEAATR